MADLDFELSEELAASIKSQNTDAEDRRCLKGKYAPPTGLCRVCSGKVVAQIEYGNNDGRIGGPPPRGYIAGWHCEDCGVSYHKLPEGVPPDIVHLLDVVSRGIIGTDSNGPITHARKALAALQSKKWK